MVVERIQKIQQQRAFFTGIYGQLHDLFVENSLQRYNLNQQLYRYLKQAGFERIVFFDLDKSFFSYDTESLVQLINTDLARQQNVVHPSTAPVTTHHEQDRRAQGNRKLLGRRNAPTSEAPVPPAAAIPNVATPVSAPSNGLIQTTDTGRIQSYQWNVPRVSVIFDKIKEFLTTPAHKGALIFTSAGHTQMAAFTGQLISVFTEVERNAALIGNQNRVFIFYEGKTAADFRAHFGGNGFLADNFFRSRFFQAEGDLLQLNTQSTFEVSAPMENEIRNALNRRRLAGEIHWHWAGLDKLVKSIYREGYLCERVMQLQQTEIDKLYQVNKQSAWERLQAMVGLERVKTEIEKELILARSPRQLMDQRRHLVFTGNPGTGKTTVARLVAEIYKENNILSRGHLVEGDRESLVAGYQGHTAIKTKALCEKALGGVLFIDEAYNLKKSEERDEFGEEAINTLLKSMEDNKDSSMVIVAGYTKQMDTFFKTNPGFRGRFGDNFIEFEDYTPPQLMKIFEKKAAKAQLNVTTILPLIEQITKKLYEQRDATFGNARTIETLVEGIVKKHTYRCVSSKVDVFTTPAIREDIPSTYMTKVQTDKTDAELEAAMKKLTDMIGLQAVKETLKNYERSIKIQQKQNIFLPKSEKANYSMNFVFSGNPGTGKTMVARLLGQILKGLGLLETDTLIEVNRDKLVAGYVGQTAIKTREVIESALGGVLFIDEAYSLANKGDTDFGHEAIETILAAMTDPRYQGKMAFVVAGYPADMDIFIQSNAGLQRRFDNFVFFDNYSSEPLVRIFEMKLTQKKYRLALGVKSKAFHYFEQLPRNRTFGNAGEAEKLVTIVISELYKRAELYGYKTQEDLFTIIPEDVPPFGQPSFALRKDLENGSVSIAPNAADKGNEWGAPATEPVAPANEPIVPANEPVEPVEPATEPVEPANEPVAPVNESVTPANEPVAPVNEPVAPTNEPVELDNEPVAPVNEPVTPVNEPVAPVEQKTVDAAYEALIRPFMCDICLIDTNIWLETREQMQRANIMSIKAISLLYQEKKKKITVLDSCCDEIETKCSDNRNPLLRASAKSAKKLISQLKKAGTISIPDVRAYTRDKDMYADPKIFAYIEAQARLGRSVLAVSNDIWSNTRIESLLDNLKEANPKLCYWVWNAAEMCSATREIKDYQKD